MPSEWPGRPKRLLETPSIGWEVNQVRSRVVTRLTVALIAEKLANTGRHIGG